MTRPAPPMRPIVSAQDEDGTCIVRVFSPASPANVLIALDLDGEEVAVVLLRALYLGRESSIYLARA